MARKSTAKLVTGNQQIVSVPLEKIIPDPEQPRKTFPPATLISLGQSLIETGQISPIVVRLGAEGKYIIVVGERRWRAAKEAGLSHIDCIVGEDLDEQKAREMQFTENYQREDIAPLEQAKSWKQYLETYNLSQSEFSRHTGIPQRTISARLALLKLPASLHARVQSGEIGPHEALQIAALPVDQQETVAEAVVSGEIGGRALEKLIHPGESPHPSNRALQSANAAETIIDLSQRLQNLEKIVYQLIARYAFNEVAKEKGSGARRALPCPECAKRGDRGAIWGIKRRMTPKDRQKLIEAIESHEDLSDEEKEDLEQEPTYVIEGKCSNCGFTEFIEYAEE